MIRIRNLPIRENIQDKKVFDQVVQKFHLQKEDILSWHISKKSIDARKKQDIHFLYTIDLEVKDETKYKNLEIVSPIQIPSICVKKSSSFRPVIIGAGPSGLFAALTFVQNGISPIIVEQGKSVEDRKKEVDLFSQKVILNPASNVQFGEGGAGTFSDGKLTTGIHNPLCKKVLEEFVHFGAPEEILYLAKPHIGTDHLIKIIRNMREYMIKKGATFHFQEKITDLVIKNGSLTSVIGSKEFPCTHAILAIGHSARDTFETLYQKKLSLEPKNFSVGVRIEHLQKMINLSQYGDQTKLNLPSAEYKLAHHLSNGRSCYTFCMCPGGVVMPSSSEPNTLVTNGMSRYARNGINANSALLVNVTPEDFENNSPLAGIYFQKDLEEKAFHLGGSNYFAPIQRVEDFLTSNSSTFIGSVKPTYLPGVTLSDLTTILPNFVTDSLQKSILAFDRKIKGFANPDAILTGVETRSSSPIRILRNEHFVSNISGIYPCGEGAGYAGGIMSAAVDGIKCATAILEE